MAARREDTRLEVLPQRTALNKRIEDDFVRSAHTLVRDADFFSELAPPSRCGGSPPHRHRAHGVCNFVCASLHTAQRKARSMKSTLAVFLAVVVPGSACAIREDDGTPPPSDDELTAVYKGGGGGGGQQPPPPTNLVSVSVTPAPLPGGHPASGIITLSGLQGNGGGSTLVSSNPAVLSVPSEIFARADQTIGWFNVVSSAVTTPTPVTITASQSTSGIVKSVVVNVVPATQPPVPDVIAVQRARFQFVGGRGGNIEVNATSTNPNAILTVFFLPGDFEGFKLVNNGGGNYSAQRPTTSSSVPDQIQIRSNFLGVSGVFDL
jgi:hypothetical protein